MQSVVCMRTCDKVICKGERMKKRNHEVRTTVSDRMFDIMNQFAKDCGVPRAYLIRCAINSYLSRKGAYTKYETH